MHCCETPNLAHAKLGPKKSRTNQVSEFCDELHTIACDIQIPDPQNSGFLAQSAVFRRSGNENFIVKKAAAHDETSNPSLRIIEVYQNFLSR